MTRFAWFECVAFESEKLPDSSSVPETYSRIS